MRNDRRKNRRKKVPEKEENIFTLKKTLYTAGIILALGVIAFIVTVIVYNRSLEKLYTDLEMAEIEDTSEVTDYLEEASINLGKTIEEIESETEEVSIENEEAIEGIIIAEETAVEETENTDNDDQSSEKSIAQESNEEQETIEEEVKLSFIMPVEGEIQKEYAKDNLVYSETLKEWVTHTGIDIKADKTTVVKASEAGTVTAIKNDPRYGITVIIEHANGYATRYANLLTAEFVTVGEEVSQGQTIGTVGNTGAFEVLDDYHLHFELLIDGEYQDPTLYLE